MPNSNPWNGTNYTYGLTRPLYNYLDNGGFAVNQRRPGTSTALTAGASSQAAYFADRWVMAMPAGGTGTFTAAQTDLSNSAGQYINSANNVELDGYFQLTSSTATLPSSTRFEQALSLSTFKTLSGRWVTLSAFIYAPAVASQSVVFQIIQYFGTGGTPSASVTYSTTVTIAALTTWQLVNFPVLLNSTSGKTFGSNGDAQLIVRVLPDVTKAFNMLITQVQLEEGPYYTGFHKKPFNEELDNCRQYYQKSFGYATLPAQNVSGAGRELFAYAIAGAGATCYWFWRFPEVMAKTPSIIGYSPAAANGLVYNYNRNTSAASTSVNSSSRVGFEMAFNPATGWAAGDLLSFNWEAKADWSDPA